MDKPQTHGTMGERCCQPCIDELVAMWKIHSHYAIPVRYGDDRSRLDEIGHPKPISRRMHRPRRCRSRAAKHGIKLGKAIFGNRSDES